MLCLSFPLITHHKTKSPQPHCLTSSAFLSPDSSAQLLPSSSLFLPATPFLLFSPLTSVMPLNGANPHDTVLPDFTSDKHTDTCLTLTETGLLEDQAIATLSRLWTLNNEKEKFQWDWLIAEEVHTTDAACQLMEVAEAHLRQQEQAEKYVTLAEE